LSRVHIIGAGLAGSEAACSGARRGIPVEPLRDASGADYSSHQTAISPEPCVFKLSESDSENTAPWLLKEEMQRAGIAAAGDRSRKPPCQPATPSP